jgi:uncharacterized protein YndB with AHSA1/START domain
MSGHWKAKETIMAQPTDRNRNPDNWQPEPLRMSRTYPVRPELLFKAWTIAEQVARFFAPAPYTVPGATIDPRVGGTYDVGMRSPEGDEHWSRGKIVELVPDRRLVIDFDTVEDGRSLFRALTALDFVEVPEGTRLDVTQSYTVFDAGRVRPMIGGAPTGWGITLDQLAGVLAGGPER